MTVPILPGCVTYGKTLDDAIRMAQEAVELYIETLTEKGEDFFGLESGENSLKVNHGSDDLRWTP